MEALDSYGEDGCGVISLSLDTGVSQQRLRSFLRKYNEYCIPLDGKTKYKLNRLTEENGSVEKMLVTIEQELAQRRVRDKVLNAFSWGLLLGLFIPVIADWLVNVYNWLL